MVLILVSSCQTTLSKSTLSPEHTGTIKPAPTQTATMAPLGSAKNPIKMAVVIDTKNIDTNTTPDQIESAANKLSQLLSQKSGYQVKSQVFSSYADLITALQKRSVHIAWLPPLTYLYAGQNNAARAAMLSNHYGVTQYGTQFLTNKNSNFTPYYDPDANKSTADATTALEQFNGMRPCWVELTSPSGYVLPAGILTGNHINVQQGAFLQTHEAVVRALYVKDICDFGVTYAYIGDPRSSISDLPYLSDQVVTIWQSDAIIPNLNVSYIPEMPPKIAESLTKSFLNLVKTDEGKSLMTTVNNNYDIQDLQEIQEGTYVPLLSAVKDLKLDLKTMLGK